MNRPKRHIHVVFFSCFIAACLAFSQESIKPEALEHKTKGLVLDRAGNFEGALREYTEAIRLQPDYALAFFDRGVVYGEIGKSEAAIADYRRAIALDATKYEYQYNLGTELRKLRRFDDAISALQAAKVLDPGNLQIRQNLGATYCNVARHKEAVTEFEELLAMDPDWNMARPCLIDSLLKLGQVKRALAVSKEFLRIEPDSADGWDRAASILRTLNEWADAEKATQMQVSVLRSNRDPRVGVALWRLAEAYDHNNKIVDARRTYQESITLLTGIPRYANDLSAVEALYNDFLRRRHLQGADPESAAKPSTRPAKPAAKSGPTLPPVPMPKTALERWQDEDQKTLQAVSRNDFSAALTQAKATAELARGFGDETEQYPRSLIRIAEIEARMGRPAEQEATLNDAVAETERRFGDSSDLTADVNEQLAQFYAYQQNNGTRAVKFFQRALVIRRKTAGDNNAMTVQTASSIASILRSLRRNEEAAALLEDVLKGRTLENTEFPLVGGFQQLGLIYSESGALDKAEKQYRLALGLMEKQFGPSHPALQGAIGPLADVLRKEGKIEEADALAHRLAALQKH